MVNIKNMQSIHYIIGLLVVVVLILGVLIISTNEKSQPTNEGINENIPAQEKKLTAWNIIKMTDWLFWPFIIITTVGIMLISYYALNEHQEKSRSQLILQGKIKANDINNFIRILKINSYNRASRLMHQIISTFNKTYKAEPIRDDVSQFLTAERESFETFNRVTGFLSDTAGALGLLGTVWGIFQTFHAGKLDGPTILKGMSISLVTTLVGLIISLIINMGATYVFTLFNKHLKLITSKAEELRQALLFLEKKSRNDNGGINDDYSDIKVVETNFSSNKHHPINVSY